MNIIHKDSSDPLLIKNAIKFLLKQSGPRGMEKEKILEHFKRIGSNMGLVNQILSQVIAENGIQVTKGINQ